MPYELSVDLGTTFTAAAVRDGGEPVMVGLGNRALQVPSVLFRTDAGFIVGEAAERRGATEPRRLVREFKRRLGDPVPILVDGVPFSAAALSATLLRWVVEAVKRRQGEAPAGLVLTHPASWGAYKLDVLREVLTLAEVGPARWCAEPVAAAGQYASRSRVEPGERLAVYDLGGGTFDACVLEKTKTGFTMLGPAEGVEHLGGVDFDEAVFEQVRTVLGDRLNGMNLDDPATIAGLARLRRDCVEAKEALSVDSETTVQVALPGLLTSVRVTRTELEQLIGPALEQTVAALARVIRAAGMTPKDLSGIVLVGGSSRIPLVGEVLQRRFEVPTAMDTHPKHDVALGALRAEAGATTVPPGGPATTGQTPAVAAAVPAAAAAAAVAAGPRSAAAAAGAGPAAPESTPAWWSPELDPGSTSTAGAGGGPGSSRLRWILGSAAVLVVLVLLAVFVVPRLFGPSGEPVVPSPTPVPTPVPSPTPTPTPTPSPTPTLPALPQSAPLEMDQLISAIDVDDNYDLYLLSANSPAPVRRLTTNGLIDRSPSLSPDRRTLVYLQVASEDDDAPRVLRVAGAGDDSGDRLLFGATPEVCRGSVSRPAWNPSDPSILAVPCSDADGKQGLYLIRTDGTVLGQVPNPGKQIGDPTFSPDGKKLAFFAGKPLEPGGGNIYVTTADGQGEQTRLTKASLPGQDADPVFSPDGTSIVFRRREKDQTDGGDLNIYVMKADGSGKPKEIAHDAHADEQDPAYSPDGTTIAYRSNKEVDGLKGGRVQRIWTMTSDGKVHRPLLTDGVAGDQTAPAWGAR